MPCDYWGQFVKDSDKLFRDANGTVKRNYETLVTNIKNENRRMRDRIDYIKKMLDLDKTLRGSSESPVISETARKFLEIMETIHRVLDNLQTIQTLCDPLNGEDPRVNPGAFENEVTSLEQDKTGLREQINNYRLFATSASGSPQLVGESTSLQTFLLQVESLLQGRVFRTICLELRNVVDRGSGEEIKKYGGLAGVLIQQLDGMMSVLNWELNEANSDGGHDAGRTVLQAEDNQHGNNDVFRDD